MLSIIDIRFDKIRSAFFSFYSISQLQSNWLTEEQVGNEKWNVNFFGDVSIFFRLGLFKKLNNLVSYNNNRECFSVDLFEKYSKDNKQSCSFCSSWNNGWKDKWMTFGNSTKDFYHHIKTKFNILFLMIKHHRGPIVLDNYRNWFSYPIKAL